MFIFNYEFGLDLLLNLSHFIAFKTEEYLDNHSKFQNFTCAPLIKIY